MEIYTTPQENKGFTLLVPDEAAFDLIKVETGYIFWNHEDNFTAFLHTLNNTMEELPYDNDLNNFFTQIILQWIHEEYPVLIEKGLIEGGFI